MGVHVRSNISRVLWVSAGAHDRVVRALTYVSVAEEFSCQDLALKDYRGLTMVIVEGLGPNECMWLRPTSTEHSNSDRIVFDRFAFVSIELIDHTARHVFQKATWEEFQDHGKQHSSRFKTQGIRVEPECLEQSMQDLVIC